MSPKMHCTALESPLNCLAVNKDCSQVVVAGRNVFKIFDIADGEFVERINLRVGRSLNLNFSAADVTWNPIDGHLLASAATNGAVVLWNLNKPSRSKQEHVYVEHRQAVNRVVFHHSESSLLISGSRDGSMKLFDLRKEMVTTTFGGHMDSVRDVQFNPHQFYMFASAYENGNIQLWDMRNPSRWERQFTAHSGPIFSIDWHPEEHYWIGSASRDKMIRVWDLQNPSKVTNTYNIQTIASVARIRWRPQRKFHIASCALLLDFNVNVWDVRRPYIPFAAFAEHKDVVTGIVWKHGDPHTFLSSSKDCMLYQHLFRDATRPADAANPVGIDINPTGSILYASSDKLAPTSTGSKAGNTLQAKMSPLFRRAPDLSEQFTKVTSCLSEFADIHQASMVTAHQCMSS
ncbi:hypothetical protein NP493_1217g00028 [Ridgeia piscesae]|uniref:GATOR2 complex protein WDR24 n=1 Tax=Ridgeia piscesae TaxID=27915 RepID=A0AAD9NFX8_RIDPI|nr:hypothetical protein NP493_1217g00028 [Ridgeia piscesae]